MKAITNAPALLSILLAVTISSASYAQGSCPSTSCSMEVSCTSCSVGQTITFDTECKFFLRKGFCEEEPIGDPTEPCEVTCEEVLFTPATVYYNGLKKVGTSWVVDADCVPGSNPLNYTFLSGDVGEYKRQTCLDNSCNTCSPLKKITVQ